LATSAYQWSTQCLLEQDGANSDTKFQLRHFSCHCCAPISAQINTLFPTDFMFYHFQLFKTSVGFETMTDILLGGV